MGHTSTWKSVERKCAALFGGSRRGADFRNRDRAGGKNDVIGVPGYSIEIKHGKSPTIGLAQYALAQATDARENETDIPIAVVHRVGTPIGNSIVFITPEHLSGYLIGSGLSRNRVLYKDIERLCGEKYPETCLPAVLVSILDKQGIVVYSVVAMRLKLYRDKIFSPQ